MRLKRKFFGTKLFETNSDCCIYRRLGTIEVLTTFSSWGKYTFFSNNQGFYSSIFQCDLAVESK